MKAKKKPVNKIAQKKAQREQQEKRMKRVMWITGACIVVLVVLLLAIRPSSQKGDFDYSSLPVLGNPDAPRSKSWRWATTSVQAANTSRKRFRLN